MSSWKPGLIIVPGFPFSVFSAQLFCQVFPIPWEAERLLLWRLWRLCLQPAHRDRTPVKESMRAAYSGPHTVPGFYVSRIAVYQHVSFSTQNEILLLQLMVMHN